LAAREKQVAGQVALWARRREAVEELRNAGAADLVSDDIGAVVDGADLVVLATPVGAVQGLMETILPLLPDGAMLTDLCSVKVAVMKAVHDAFEATGREGVSFVGGHPMAGSDQVGFANARADLFEGAVCAVTPGNHGDGDAATMVARFWAALGCRTLSVEAAEHDRLVAKISHLPHLAASALVNASLGGSAGAGALAGSGFRDSTRIASGPPEMWAEIVAENRDEVVAALEGYIGELGEVLAKLRDMDNEGVCRFLADAQTRRGELGPPGGGA